MKDPTDLSGFDSKDIRYQKEADKKLKKEQKELERKEKAAKKKLLMEQRAESTLLNLGQLGMFMTPQEANLYISELKQ